MIWNSRKPRVKEIDGIKWTIKPFTAIEQAEFAERLAAMPNESIKERTKALYETFEWLLNTAVKNIEGLKDEDGNPVDFDSVPKKEIALGLGMGDFANLCDMLTEINTVPESAKKKSLPPPEYGTDS